MTVNTTDNSRKLRNGEVQLLISPEKNQFVYFAKAAPIVNIVFSGGGAKGIYYPGVVASIVEEGIRENIEAVAGSSVGAATAAFFAFNMSVDKFKASGKVNFETLLHSDKNNNPIVGKDGTPMKNYIEDELQKCVLEFIQSDEFRNIDLGKINFFPDVIRKVDGKDEVIVASHATREYFEFLQKSAKTGNLGTVLSPTFAMLDVLRQMSPEKFKDLTVTAVCCETGELVYFNAENTPNLPISLACRASASLPVFFEPVGIYKNLLNPLFKDKKEEKFTFIDGGTYNNTPADPVTHKQTLIPGKNKGERGQNLQTLVFAFDDNSAYGENYGETSLSNTESTLELRPSNFHRVPTENKPSPLYDPSMVEETVRNNLVSGLLIPEKQYSSTQSEIDVLEKVRTDHMLRTIAIPVKGGISTVAFEQAMNESEQRIDEGYKVAKNYFDIHRDEVIHHSFDNIYDLLLFMPMEELEELNKNKKPNLIDADILSKVIDFRTNLDDKISKLNVNGNILIATADSLLPKGLPEDGKKLFENYIVNRLRELNYCAAADNLQQKYYERDHKKKPPLVNKILSGIKLTPSENLIIAETIEKHFNNNGKFGSINMDKLKLADPVTQTFGMYYVSCKQDNWGEKILTLTENKKKISLGRRKLNSNRNQSQSDNHVMLQSAFQVEIANAVSEGTNAGVKKPIGPIAQKILKDALDEPTIFGKFFNSETFQTNEIAKKILRNTPSNLIKALVENCTTKEAKKIVEIVLNIPIENQSQMLSREPGFSDDLYRTLAQKCKTDLSKKTTFRDMIFNSEAYQAKQEAKETLNKIPQHLKNYSNQNLSNNKTEMRKRDSMYTTNNETMDDKIIISHKPEDFNDTTIGTSPIEKSDPINLSGSRLTSVTM